MVDQVLIDELAKPEYSAMDDTARHVEIHLRNKEGVVPPLMVKQYLLLETAWGGIVIEARNTTPSETTEAAIELIETLIAFDDEGIRLYDPQVKNATTNRLNDLVSGSLLTQAQMDQILLMGMHPDNLMSTVTQLGIRASQADVIAARTN